MLYVIRHGETEWNRQGKIQGIADTSLSEKGLEEARFLARLINGLEIKRIICSDLERARTTAAILAGNSIPLSLDPRLRERSFGKYESLTVSEINDELSKRFNHNPELFDPVFEWPDKCEVESLAQVLERAWAAISEVQEEIEHQHLALVTHGNVVYVLLCHILHVPLQARRGFRLPNCCCLELETRKGCLLLRSMLSPEMLDSSLFRSNEK